jgi:hypothetical protein
MRLLHCARHLIAFGTVFAALAGASAAEPARIVMKPLGTGMKVSPQIVGGQKLDTDDWPATLVFETSDGMCTSTIVGARTVLTAAHCVAHGGSADVLTKNKTITVRCEHHPSYNPVYLSADIALCVATEDIANGHSYERLSLNSAIVREQEPLFLLGYGCTEVGKPNTSGVLYGGSSFVQVLASANEPHIQTNRSNGGVMLCPGDSGGAAFQVDDIKKPIGSRRIIGVNSAYHPGTQYSYVAPLSLPTTAAFIRDWAELHQVAICGVHSAAKLCR